MRAFCKHKERYVSEFSIIELLAIYILKLFWGIEIPRYILDSKIPQGKLLNFLSKAVSLPFRYWQVSPTTTWEAKAAGSMKWDYLYKNRIIAIMSISISKLVGNSKDENQLKNKKFSQNETLPSVTEEKPLIEFLESLV